LLDKDHQTRLGAGPEDNLEIRKHPWFNSIDFEKLLKFNLPAPIIPEVLDETDVENFNQKYTTESTPEGLISRTEDDDAQRRYGQRNDEIRRLVQRVLI
jgi:hypothetical protein